MADKWVRVEPSVIHFSDVRLGQVYKTYVKATNMGKKMKKITFQPPPSKLFKFAQSKSDVMVVPGLHVGGLLEFSPGREFEHVRSALMVQIDHDSIEVPILVSPVSCCLIMNPVVDFGCVPAISQILSKHPITNCGSAPGWFQLQQSKDPSIKITPLDGVVAADATQWVTVELRTDEVRQFNDDVFVKLQNCSLSVLNIRAKVVDHRLGIFDLQGDPLTCQWFGPVYFGTSCEDTVVLRNISPQACDWVCVLQTSLEGTELGTDIQRSTTTDTTLLEEMHNCSLHSAYISEIFVCSPTHGRLEAYDQTTLTLRFTPVRKRSDKERQDYSIFIRFESVGTKHGFTHHNGNTGESVDLLCVLQNCCLQLPVNFRFKKKPHFSTNPLAGTIAPGQCKEIVISFSPRQQGTFQMIQKIDVLGPVKQQGDSNPNDEFKGLQLRTFHAITLHLSGTSCSRTTYPLPNLNPGITPLVTNLIGPQPYVQLSDISCCRGIVPAVVLRADKSEREAREKTQLSGKQDFVAFPNNRPQSLRSLPPHTQCRTIFPDVPHHCYVDTTYTLTRQEAERSKKNLQKYSDLFKCRRERRLQKLQWKQQERIENDLDIGIEPCQGLEPPKLICRNVQKNSTLIKSSFQNNFNEKQNVTPVKYKTVKEVSGLINAIPSTSQQVAECHRTLSIPEMYQVVVGPLSVDFGEVCLRSFCTQRLEMINHLSAHVWVQFEVNCPELQGSSPVSYVLPPHSQAALTLTFQSTQLGEFYQTVPYTVNQNHPGQVLVQAQVVPVALTLSTDELVVHPSSTLLARSGFRSWVTLRNLRNHPAEFSWKPIISDRGICFSIRPATGVVDPYKELDCEVVWHASFSSSVEGDFDLIVTEGEKRRLHCEAKVGCTTVHLAQKTRVTFDSVPLNVTSVRTAVLLNTGANHAFFQVQNVCPLRGMVVSPAEGMVVRGGQAILSIHFNPESVIKFDTRFEVTLKGMESIEVRVGGSVEPPNVEISRLHFQLFGIYLGSQKRVPFTLTNHSSAPAYVAFDLSEYKDFSVQTTDLSADPVTVVEMQGNQTASCFLVFCPTQVASYDFELPMTVNGMIFFSALQLSLPHSPSTLSSSCTLTSGKSKTNIHPVPLLASVVSTSRYVEATAILSPIHISPDKLCFSLASMSKTYTQAIVLKAESDTSWFIDCLAAGMSRINGEELICTASPSFGKLKLGQSICVEVTIRSDGLPKVPGAVIKLTLPLYLGDKRQEIKDYEEQYRELSIIVHPLPHFTVHPPQLLLTPVPLGCCMTVTLTVIATGYTSGTHFSADIDHVGLDSGRIKQPLSLTFPQGTQIPPQDQNRNSIAIAEKEATYIICNLTFASDTPLSLTSIITFRDHFQNGFPVKVWAVADNCLLTVWPYLALHHSEQQIVLKPGSTVVEAVLQNFHIPSVGSFASASTIGLSSLIKKISSADTLPESFDTSDNSSSEEEPSFSGTPSMSGVPEFYTSNSELGLFYQSVLVAVERWFSLFGPANGSYPIDVPHTMRRIESKVLTNEITKKKNIRSIVDLLIHLTGKAVPGLPHSLSISEDLNRRTSQLIQLYKAILEFLSIQGACLTYIRPEYLLDKNEFLHWCSLQMNDSTNSVDYSSINYESMSKRSWMDLLLQIFKVFILCRVPCNSRDSNTDKVAPTCLQPQASNIYSPFELEILSWLNLHYESMRKTVWTADCTPPARWIVNFDLDFTNGLVLATVLAAHCPYLIGSDFGRMYTRPSSMEEILHNNIIVVQALTTLSLNIDIYPTDLSEPNPVQILMLCVHLNKKLPQYQPRQTITFLGKLHCTISKQVHLTIPTAKPVKYKVLLLGKDAHLFSLPGGSSFTFSPKSCSDLYIQYSCAFLQPKEAALLLVASSTITAHGTLAFYLKTCVTHLSPMKIVKCSSSVYELKSVQLNVSNTFKYDGNFRVKLVDFLHNPLKSEKLNQYQQTTCQSCPLVDKLTEDKLTDHNVEEDTEFLCAVKNVFLNSAQECTLNIDYLPFSLGNRYCCVLLTCPQSGDMFYMIEARADLPQPLILSAKSSEHLQLSSDCRCVEIPLCFQSDSVGTFTSKIVLQSWCDTRVYMLEAMVTTQEQSAHLLFTIPAHRSVTQYIPLCNDGDQDLNMKATVSGNGFSGPEIINLAPGTEACYPLTFHPDRQDSVMGKLILHNERNGTEHVFTLRGVGEQPPPVDHLVLHCPVGRSTKAHLNVPNYSKTKLQLKVVTDLFIISGSNDMEIKPGQSAPYTLIVTPTKRGIKKGCVSFVDMLKQGQESCYEVHFTLDIICEAAEPLKHIHVQCLIQNNVAIELPINNPCDDQLNLDVYLEGDGLSGDKFFSVPPQESLNYKMIYSPSEIGKCMGSVVFQSELDELWYHLELYALPLPVVALPEIKCPLGKWSKISLPLVNPTATPVEIAVMNNNDRNYTLEMDSNNLTLQPHSSSQLVVRFSPSSVGEKDHKAEITFSSCHLEPWTFLLCGCGLNPESEKPKNISAKIGSWASTNIPFSNPTQHQALLRVTLTDSHPKENQICSSCFTVPMSHLKGVLQLVN
ncbi:unnamed protein product [Knipowitschia caucasica]